jgi:hypothetical protein
VRGRRHRGSAIDRGIRLTDTAVTDFLGCLSQLQSEARHVIRRPAGGIKHDQFAVGFRSSPIRYKFHQNYLIDIFDH